jgi:Glutamyl-tRNAGlu reductase, N-terminal domain
MSLGDLMVLNRKVAAGLTTGPLGDACSVVTCLREVRIAALPVASQPSLSQCQEAGFDRYNGADAYLFLLQLACGLESEIAGETEILGQIKQAWRDHELAQPASARALRPFMQRLLQETKEIRTEYVVGLGSATYGSLVRRLLATDLDAPMLLLGAGQLAETVLPYLDGNPLWIHNRHAERAHELLKKQRAGNANRLVLDSSLEAELAAWRRAHHVVICVPADPERDAARVVAWRAHPKPHGRVLHLGLDQAAGTVWDEVADIATLRDLFGLRDAQASQRSQLLAKAQRACSSKSQLALLDDADGSRPGSSNHGWEDLAVFQAFGY